jgi:hypothetical protein
MILRDLIRRDRDSHIRAASDQDRLVRPHRAQPINTLLDLIVNDEKHDALSQKVAAVGNLSAFRSTTLESDKKTLERQHNATSTQHKEKEMAKKSAKRTMKKSSARKAGGSKGKSSKKATKKASKKTTKKSVKKSVKKATGGMMKRMAKPMKRARKVMTQVKEKASTMADTVTKVVATAAGTVVGAVESVMPDSNTNETGSSST